MKRNVGLVFLVTLVLFAPSFAAAFCGFYVNKAGGKLYANATRVVMMREGKTTVLTMQNNYQGPPKNFAMVIPVPQILSKKNVKTLPHGVMNNIDKVTAPRLVEYWKNPLPKHDGIDPLLDQRNAFAGSTGISASPPKVVVEAEFTAGEYNIVILSAKEATALEKWLKDAKYNIPKGAAPYFEPYVQAGMYFFAARVDVSKVKFEDGQALLSPLRFHYESNEFSLPIRLGLINAKGEQDLIVYTLAKDQRYEVANRKNVFIPTNIEVEESVKDNFAGFYESVFANTMKQNPGAVVTEYAWVGSKCDPCPPQGALQANDIASFGGDLFATSKALQVTEAKSNDPNVKKLALYHSQRMKRSLTRCSFDGSDIEPRKLRLEIDVHGRVKETKINKEKSRVSRCLAAQFSRRRFPRTSGEKSRSLLIQFKPETYATPEVFSRYVVTRLHARYTKEQTTSDLVFKKAAPVVGGREFPRNGMALETGASPGNLNNFQARYIIRHDKPNPSSRRTLSVSTPQAPVEQTKKPKAVRLSDAIKEDDLSRLKAWKLHEAE